jgi:RNA polymerase sigma-70 factor (ECF subfamily)
VDDAIAAMVRDDYGRIFAMLVRRLGDFHAAEDALAEAMTAAAETWPRTGVPERPAAWIATAARNAGLSAIRHQSVVRDKQDAVAEALAPPGDDGDIPDERLRLIFTCCHPALADDARIALTLHTLCGLATPAIARLFFVSDATIAQRLVRAKRKIKTSRIPYVVPSAEMIDERVDAVLAVVYLLFTDGHAWRGEVQAIQLCDEAIRLARVLCRLMPRHAEARGLLALMLLHHARRDARDDGAMPIALDEQDRGRWHRDEIDDGCRQLDEALAHAQAGPYQIQAAIAALHAGAPTAAATDWTQIAGLYRELWERQPSPSVAVAMAVADGMADGAETGLARLAELEAAGALAGSDRVVAARADLLRRAGHHADAAITYDLAGQLATSERERRFFSTRAVLCRAAVLA